MRNQFQHVAPPPGYQVVRVAFQQWMVQYQGQLLPQTFQFQHHAANRAHRHSRGRNW